MKSILLISCLIAFTAGCALSGGAYVRKQTVTQTNNVTVTTTETAKLRPFVAFGDSGMNVAKERISNSKTGNSIGITGFEESASATNVAPIVGSFGNAFGQAYRAFVTGQ